MPWRGSRLASRFGTLLLFGFSTTSLGGSTLLEGVRWRGSAPWAVVRNQWQDCPGQFPDVREVEVVPPDFILTGPASGHISSSPRRTSRTAVPRAALWGQTDMSDMGIPLCKGVSNLGNTCAPDQQRSPAGPTRLSSSRRRRQICVGRCCRRSPGLHLLVLLVWTACRLLGEGPQCMSRCP